MGKKRLLVALLVGLFLMLASCSEAPPKVQYPWQTPPNIIEADGTVFVIPLKGGDRVKIEVSNATGISTLKDPLGNMVAQSATKTRYWTDNPKTPDAAKREYHTGDDNLDRILEEMQEADRINRSLYESRDILGNSRSGEVHSQTTSTQVYPWRFAFVVASSGKYVLETSGIIIVEPNMPSKYRPAHIKVTFNP